MSSATAYQVIVKQLGEMAGGTIHAATLLPLSIPSRASRARASQLYRYAGKMRSKAFPAAVFPGIAVVWSFSTTISHYGPTPA